LFSAADIEAGTKKQRQSHTFKLRVWPGLSVIS
jgi:hypothetical protein